MAKDKPEKDKPDRKPKPPKRRPNLQGRAERDVQLSQQPLIDQLERAMAGAQSAYGGYEDLLSGMVGDYSAQTGDIAGDLQSQLASLTGLLSGNLPGSEIGAASALFGGYGAGALEQLASQSQRNLDYQSSARREGGLASRYAQDNLIQQMNELYAQRPLEIRQRLDELRDKALEKKLVQSQLAGDEAFNQFLQGQIGNLTSNTGPGRNPGPGPRPGGPTSDNVPGRFQAPPRLNTNEGKTFEAWLKGVGANVQAPGDPYTEFLQGTQSWQELTKPEIQNVYKQFRQEGFRPRMSARRVRKYYA